MRYVQRYSSRWLVLMVPTLFIALEKAHAQPGCDTSRVTVKGDLSKRQLDALPFDVPFTIRTPVPTLNDGKLKVDSIVLRYGPPVRLPNGFDLGPSVRTSALVQGAAPPTELTFSVRALRPNQVQYFHFFLHATRSVKAHPEQLLRQYTMKVATFDAEKAVFVVRDSVVREYRMDTLRTAVDTIRIVGTPRATFANRFDADAGVLWAPGFGYWGVGANSHFYFTPVNRNQCTTEYRGMDHVLKRVSVFGGVSLFRIHSDTEVQHLWTNGSPVVGVGLNRLPVVPARLNAGIIWLRQDDPNPLVTRDVVKRDLFISGTVDFELRQLAGPLAALVGLR